ncbi:MAG TPA: hypothetical protein VGA04_25635 [Streptosporangiaceae bacterium]
MPETLIGYARCSTDEQDLTAQRLVPGRAAVGQVLAVAGTGVWGDGDRGLGADFRRFLRRGEDLGPAVAR